MNLPDENPALKRREFLQSLSIAAAGLAFAPLRGQAASETLNFGNGTRELVAYPQKQPLLRVTARPPHLETPFSVFNEGLITPNDAFFVRYHLANMPTAIDAEQHRLKISGLVHKPLSLSLAELKKLGEPMDVVAVNQCAGNSRGFSSPRVFGAQLGNGSMGNARWTGIPLKTVLKQAGVQAGAKQVTFRGLDNPVLPGTSNFVKALDIDLALSGEPLIAWAMNGADIPFLNGYPIKLIVPGYFGTYWIKHLSEIAVIDHDYDGFFMKTAYRLPDNDCLCIAPGATPDKTKPIGQLKIRSFITSLRGGETVRQGKAIFLRGIAFDSGAGISAVEISDDNGKHWQPATLSKSLGKYSFQEWQATWKPREKGNVALQVRARNRLGEQQPAVSTWNPGGYMRNVVETIPVRVV
jgi:DMSO/TMAO reductase YedYZ molybdopterin-dependent catalytic subunit